MNATELLSRYAAGERDFRAAYLARANLDGANLSGATLARANLAGASLLAGCRRFTLAQAREHWTGDTRKGGAISRWVLDRLAMLD